MLSYWNQQITLQSLNLKDVEVIKVSPFPTSFLITPSPNSASECECIATPSDRSRSSWLFTPCQDPGYLLVDFAVLYLVLCWLHSEIYTTGIFSLLSCWYRLAFLVIRESINLGLLDLGFCSMVAQLVLSKIKINLRLLCCCIHEQHLVFAASV